MEKRNPAQPRTAGTVGQPITTEAPSYYYQTISNDRIHHAGITVDTARPQRKMATQEHLEHLEEGSGKRNVDSVFHVELEEDGGGSKRQNWTETNAL